MSMIFMKTAKLLTGMSGALLLVAGLSQGAEPTAADPVPFAALFKSASEVGSDGRVIVADDFEKGIVAEVSRDPAGDMTGYRFQAPAPRLRAYLAGVELEGEHLFSVDENHVASGAKALRLRDSPSLKVDFMPILSWWLYGEDVPRHGTLRIAFDLLIPGKDGALDLLARDHTPTRSHRARVQQTHFNLGCRYGKVALGGRTVPVAQGKWAHYDLALPLGDAAGKIRLTVQDTEHGIQSIESPLDDAANGVSWIGLGLPGKNDGSIVLDNLVMTVLP